MARGLEVIKWKPPREKLPAPVQQPAAALVRNVRTALSCEILVELRQGSGSIITHRHRCCGCTLQASCLAPMHLVWMPESCIRVWHTPETQDFIGGDRTMMEIGYMLWDSNVLTCLIMLWPEPKTSKASNNVFDNSNGVGMDYNIMAVYYPTKAKRLKSRVAWVGIMETSLGCPVHRCHDRFPP